MKARDIANAYDLLKVVSSPGLRERLEALAKAKTEADEAKAKAEQAQQVQETFGDRLEKDRKQLVKFNDELIQRENRLKDAEQQHQFRMDGEIKGLRAQKEAFGEQVEGFTTRSKAVNDKLAERAAELDKREKVLAKRELDAQKRDEDLTAREQAWLSGVKELESTKRKLKELTQ